MKIVVDTNVILSGLVWHGAPRQIVIFAEMKKVKIFGTLETYEEFVRVVSYRKFTDLLKGKILSPIKLVFDYENLVNLVPSPLEKTNIIKEDPTDNIFIDTARASGAKLIVSGDQHLKGLRRIDDINIVEPLELVKIVDLVERKSPPRGLQKFPKHPRIRVF